MHFGSCGGCQLTLASALLAIAPLPIFQTKIRLSIFQSGGRGKLLQIRNNICHRWRRLFSGALMASTFRSYFRLRLRNVLGLIALAAILLLTYLSFGGSLVLPMVPYAYQSDNNTTLVQSTVDPHPTPNTIKTSGWEMTTIPSGAHVHGFTVLDNIYLRNGTFYVVTDDRTSLPPRDRLLSLPIDLKGGVKMDPTDEQLQFIHPDDAIGILGDRVTRIEEFSVIVYDPPQFMKHFYHWFGEIILGAWRVYSHILLSPDAQTSRHLTFPRRFILPFVSNEEWRDKAGIDGPLMRAAFPGAAIEQAGYWNDLKKVGTTVVFERVMLVNRSAAHKHPFGGVWYKMIAGTMNVTAPHDFWAPVRDSLWQNVLAPSFLPTIYDSSRLPLVTYVSRQGSGRRLVAADHDALVAALKALEAEGVCEVQVAAMERITMKEQIELVARTRILVGVHGNGLTHQLWMPPHPRSTAIEIFVPNGYVFDYEMLARNMGHRHYAVWNDTFLTYPEGTYHKGVKYPDGFHGVNIPVYAPTVIGIIRERLGSL
ncbi:hypothetical protein MVEN_01334100 [Mycena venus]|uniref:Glycosyltransferase 61 catalytic domain-containing protein n=1 Tax=Mycena venus TaxID=2733690 RepID=A0A8H6Y1Z9_9AGAR|nr:hypothetical protein MVEN_01334100 [Mycena venus]